MPEARRVVWSQAAAGDLAAIAEFIAARSPATVLGELHAGFEMGTRRERNVATLKALLEQPGVGIAVTTHAVGERYGRLVRELRDRGTPIPTNDIWIAAAALETGARLIAYDEH